MNVLKRCATAGLLLAALASAAFADAPEAITRLGNNVVPTFQSIELTIDANRADYEGSVRIALEVRERTSTFLFHSEGPTLGTVELSAAGRTIALTHAPVGKDMVRVTTAEPLEPGPCELRISFTNPFDVQAASLYKLTSGGDAYTFTQFEATDAREAFPCWDEPEFKIPWQFTLTVPAAHMAITNTPIERTEPQGEMKRVTFQKTKPMSSYLLAIATGPFDTAPIEGLGVAARVVAPRGQADLSSHAIAMTPPILKALETYFGSPYPYEKLDLIAVPEYWYGAMENPGAITFRDNALLLKTDASVADRRRLASWISHELAHMWFGDVVTMKWWDDLWLNESFATWIGEKTAQQVYPEFQIDLRSVGDIDRAKLTDARLTTRVIRQPVTNADNLGQMADALAYDKGHAVLDMFEQWLGPETFRRGVRDYLSRHAWGNAEAADLWAALGRASRQKVGATMGTFLDQAGIPLVTIDVRPGGQVTLRQERFLNFGLEAPAQTWAVPVTLRHSDGEKTQTTTVLLERAVQSVRLATGKRTTWVHPNADERGYYRWRVDDATLATLREHRDELTARERKAFMLNASALLDAGALHGDAFLALIERFAADPEPEVVDAALECLDKVEGTFINEALEQPFRAYARRVLEAPLGRFGLEPSRGESEAARGLRPGLLRRYAQQARDPIALSHGESLADAWFEDPSAVDPSLLSTALRVAAIRGDQARFDAYRKRFEETRVPSERSALLGAMAGFQDPGIVDQALAYALSGPLRPQEVGVAPLGLMDTEARRDRAFRWMTENYNAITQRIPVMFYPYLTRFAGGCSEQRLDAARAFFSDPERQVPGVQLELDKTASQVMDCVSLRDREGPAVTQYLQGQLGSR